MGKINSKSDTSNTEGKEVVNRVIKFRAWDGKYMILPEYSNWISFDGCAYTDSDKKYNTPNIEIESVKGYILMQFTGLTDIEGKECFDNDIIINKSRNGGAPHIIKWSNRYAAWVGYYGIEYLIAEEMYEIIKVGNNYEHPQLLTQKSKIK